MNSPKLEESTNVGVTHGTRSSETNEYINELNQY
jgi:hypothetical protein